MCCRDGVCPFPFAQVRRSPFLLVDPNSRFTSVKSCKQFCPASLSTINGATMRLCRGDSPAADHPIAAGSRSCRVLPGAAGRVLSETRRIRSHYLLPDEPRTSRTLKTPPPEGRALLYTINAATMRPCRGDSPAAHHPIAAGSHSYRVRTFLVGCARPTSSHPAATERPPGRVFEPKRRRQTLALPAMPPL